MCMFNYYYLNACQVNLLERWIQLLYKHYITLAAHSLRPVSCEVDLVFHFTGQSLLLRSDQFAGQDNIRATSQTVHKQCVQCE